MFIVLVTRVILALDLNLYIPLSKVTIILFFPAWTHVAFGVGTVVFFFAAWDFPT